jgi:RNA polymerase sigma-70 factor (ECF subfamily)
LVEATQQGEGDAFGALVRRYQQRIYALAYHLVQCRPEAEDVTQETFVRAYQAIDRFDVRNELGTWLFRIAVNLSLNSIRDRKAKRYAPAFDADRIQDLVSETRPSHGSDPARASHERQLARALCEGIEALSETLRTTLILVCVDGLEHADVATILGCPEGTVSWRVHEARRKLREHLALRGFGGET